MIEWCKIEEVNDIQFLVSKNYEEKLVTIETQNRTQGFLCINFDCKDGKEMDDVYDNFEGEEIWEYYQNAIATLN